MSPTAGGDFREHENLRSASLLRLVIGCVYYVTSLSDSRCRASLTRPLPPRLSDFPTGEIEGYRRITDEIPMESAIYIGSREYVRETIAERAIERCFFTRSHQFLNRNWPNPGLNIRLSELSKTRSVCHLHQWCKIDSLPS